MPALFWSRRSGKDLWLRRLSGQMPEPSAADLGVAAWISHLGASRANPTPKPGASLERKTSATSGPPSAAPSCNPGSGPSSSKMSAGCSTAGAPSRSTETFGALVSRLRSDFSRRKSAAQKRMAAHRTSENASSSSDAGASARPTPRTITGAPESAERKQELGRVNSGGGDLQAAAKTWGSAWPTPAARDHKGVDRTEIDRGNARPLNEVAAHWQTPSVASATGGQASRGGDHQDELLLAGQARAVSSSLAPTNGAHGDNYLISDRTLNPQFVEALMVWPTGLSAFACSETELSRFRADMRSVISRLPLPSRAPAVQPDLFG